MSKIRIAQEWEALLYEELQKPYFQELRGKVRQEYLTKEVFPKPGVMFRALDMCKPSDIRVVILGQDPYHTPGVADGLAFSSVPGNAVPPSLQNIYKEIEAEFGSSCVKSADLTHWAEQGVLLLNASLTVESGVANSHSDIGWHEFTDAVIQIISESQEYNVFMLWGNYARAKRSLIDHEKHLVLESAHPSPLSVHKGFSGNGHFKATNEYLSENGRGEISWC